MAGLKYWVWLNECRGLTNRSRALLLDHFGSPEDVYYADEAEYALVEGLSKSRSSCSPTNRRTARTKFSAIASVSACAS